MLTKGGLTARFKGVTGIEIAISQAQQNQISYHVLIVIWLIYNVG